MTRANGTRFDWITAQIGFIAGFLASVDPSKLEILRSAEAFVSGSHTERFSETSADSDVKKAV